MMPGEINTMNVICNHKMHCGNAKKMATAPVNLARQTEHWVQKYTETPRLAMS